MMQLVNVAFTICIILAMYLTAEDAFWHLLFCIIAAENHKYENRQLSGRTLCDVQNVCSEDKSVMNCGL